MGRAHADTPPRPDPRVWGRRATVVGSGPNGLTAAVVLARAGMDVTVYEAADEPGGATRSAPLFGDGTVVDLGAAGHPFGVSSPILSALDLGRHGLEWVHPQTPAAHPLDDGPAALLHRDLDRTVHELEGDGPAWRRLHAFAVEQWDGLVESVLSPLLRVPDRPVTMARFGLRGALPATVLARVAFRGARARALFAGSAAHSFMPLHHPLTSAFGVLFGAAAHARGWPVARGGSQAIARALVAELRTHGGQVVTGHRVRDLSELEPAEVTMLDVGPHQAAALLGDRLPSRRAAALRRWRYGTGVHKVDYLLDGPAPWADGRVGGAGTVHLGGTLEEVAHVEAAVAAGRFPRRPFVLVCQQSAADPTRVPAGKQIVYAYAHTPNSGSDPLTGARVDAQLERFAPGFTDRVLARVETGPDQLARQNPNLVGGDVIGGSVVGTQQLLRPRATLSPYHLAPGFYLCSASTPPGGGVHGMCGYHAAVAALTSLKER